MGDTEQASANRKLVNDSAACTNDKIGALSQILGVFGSNTDTLVASVTAAQPTGETFTPLRATRQGSRANTPEVARIPGAQLDFATVLEAILTKLCSMDKRLGDIETGLASK